MIVLLDRPLVIQGVFLFYDVFIVNIKIMKKIRLTEKELTNIIKRVINENQIINEGRELLNIDGYIETDGGIKIIETKEGGKIKLQRKGDNVIFIGEVGPGFLYQQFGTVDDLY